MSSLVIHAGATRINPEDLHAVETPQPSGRHYPIPHARVRDLVAAQIVRRGYRIAGEECALHTLPNGLTRAFGLFTLARPGQETQSVALTVGWRGAHDKAFRATVTGGNRTFVCDNLAFSGDVVIGHKNTRWAMRDLPGRVEEGLDHVLRGGRSLLARMGIYAETSLSDRQVDLILMQLIRSRSLAPSAVPKILSEYEAPRHREHDADGRTALTLLNAGTEVLKGRDFTRLVGQTIALETEIARTVSAGLPGPWQAMGRDFAHNAE